MVISRRAAWQRRFGWWEVGGEGFGERGGRGRYSSGVGEGGEDGNLQKDWRGEMGAIAAIAFFRFFLLAAGVNDVMGIGPPRHTWRGPTAIIVFLVASQAEARKNEHVHGWNVLVPLFDKDCERRLRTPLVGPKPCFKYLHPHWLMMQLARWHPTIEPIVALLMSH